VTMLARWEGAARVGAKRSGLLIKMGFPQSGTEGGQKDAMCKGQVGVRKGV
jgi:hypothetical protein